MEKSEFKSKLNKAIRKLKDSRNTLNSIKWGVMRDLDLYLPDYPEVMSSLDNVKMAISRLETLQSREKLKQVT